MAGVVFMKLVYSHSWRMVCSLLIQVKATKKRVSPPASQESSCSFFTAGFYICFFSGTLLACTASIDKPLLLSLYTDDAFWKGNPFAVALSTPLLCVCFFHCKPHGEAESVIMKASPPVINFVPYFNCLEYSVSLK